MLAKAELFPSQSTRLAHKTMTLLIAAPHIGIANDADDVPGAIHPRRTFMTVDTTLTILWQ